MNPAMNGIQKAGHSGMTWIFLRNIGYQYPSECRFTFPLNE
jgi:hypothetical protein